MNAKNKSRSKEKYTVRRLVWANVIAALAFLVVLALVLTMTGLMDSVWDFLF